MTSDAAVEAMAEAAWNENARLVAEDGMEMPSWHRAELDVKQRWRKNQRAALAAALPHIVEECAKLFEETDEHYVEGPNADCPNPTVLLSERWPGGQKVAARIRALAQDGGR